MVMQGKGTLETGARGGLRSVVIGAGVSGCACAAALVERGRGPGAEQRP